MTTYYDMMHGGGMKMEGPGRGWATAETGELVEWLSKHPGVRLMLAELIRIYPDVETHTRTIQDKLEELMQEYPSIRYRIGAMHKIAWPEIISELRKHISDR